MSCAFIFFFAPLQWNTTAMSSSPPCIFFGVQITHANYRWGKMHRPRNYASINIWTARGFLCFPVFFKSPSNRSIQIYLSSFMLTLSHASFIAYADYKLNMLIIVKK